MKKNEVWMDWCFDTNCGFRSRSCSVKYDRYELEIRIDDGPYAPDIYVATFPNQHDKVHEAIFGFLSELSWLFQTRVEMLTYVAGSGPTKKVGCKQPQWIRKDIANHIDLVNYHQIGNDDISKLALGLYREGISSNSHFYSFLCYFKIIMIQYPSESKASKWINNNLNTVSQHKNIISNLQNKKIPDIGKYLYQSGRCALAHCDWQRKKKGEPIVNPNNYDDIVRIYRERSLIKELAEIFMNNELSIPSYFEALKIWEEEHYKNIRNIK